jgi:1-acyl-sn-glycerol-3-phosphate acyltransferase
VNAAKRFYRRAYALAIFIFGIFFRFEIEGLHNIPQGAAVVCANHSCWLDPIFLEFAFGKDNQVHIIGKASLFRVPALSWLIRKLEMIPVDRGRADVTAMRESLRYLGKGEKVAIFPEGRRLQSDDVSAAKSGAVWLANRAGAPILPMYIPRKKPLFHKVRMVVGAPYGVQAGGGHAGAGGRLRGEDFKVMAEQVLERIAALRPE